MNLEELKREFVDFSLSETRQHSDAERDWVLRPASCFEHSLPIVEELFGPTWLGDPDALSGSWIDLGMIVASIIFNQTKDNWSWKTVAGVISESGNYDIAIVELYPSSEQRMCSGAKKAKSIVRDVARKILLMEVMSFLVLKDIDKEYGLYRPL